MKTMRDLFVKMNVGWPASSVPMWRDMCVFVDQHDV